MGKSVFRSDFHLSGFLAFTEVVNLVYILEIDVVALKGDGLGDRSIGVIGIHGFGVFKILVAGTAGSVEVVLKPGVIALDGFILHYAVVDGDTFAAVGDSAEFFGGQIVVGGKVEGELAVLTLLHIVDGLSSAVAAK